MSPIAPGKGLAHTDSVEWQTDRRILDENEKDAPFTKDIQIEDLRGRLRKDCTQKSRRETRKRCGQIEFS